ncbi:MAG: PLDc N-terminal domain-containing protein [Elusimicrobia bacterium]|nr:PLDc N-terminal domain-containing protein [Elusimicrobiota bacterium]
MRGLLGLVILVLDILAIIECLKSAKPTIQKALWIIVILVLPLVGLILYYFFGRKK